MSPEPKRRRAFLLVCSSYPPVLGGSEIEAQRVCASFIERDYRVLVLTTGGPPMPAVDRFIDPQGVPVRLFGGSASGALREYWFALGVAWTLFRERNTYDFVYFLMQGIHLAVGLPVARMLGKPIYMKISGSGVIPGMARSWTGRLELKWLQRWAARTMILNEGMKTEALEQGFRPEQLSWMPNPVNTDVFAPISPAGRKELRTKLGVPLDACVILYVGRLSPEKGVDILMESFAAVADQVPEALLILVGDGPSRPQLEELRNRLPLSPRKIMFAGRVDPEAVAGWMQASDVFSLVSPNEGFPCALVEAMATGLCSVVSDIPGNTQLIEDGVHGLTAPFANQERTAEALLRLLRHPEERARMGANARSRVVEHYSTEQICKRYEDLFRQSLPRPSGDSG
jgi:glycosyltransferase involved in cell wall biosynthesis